MPNQATEVSSTEEPLDSASLIDIDYSQLELISLNQFPKLEAAILKAHQQSCHDLPTGADLATKSVVCAIGAAIAYFAFRSSALYARDGVDHFLKKLFNTTQEVSGLPGMILIGGTMIPAMALSTRSFQRIAFSMAKNWKDVLTLGAIRRINFHENKLEIILDVAGMVVTLGISTIACASTAYASYHRLHELPYDPIGDITEVYVSSEVLAQVYARCAQFSSISTNSLLIKNIFIEPSTEAIGMRIKAQLKSQVNRATMIAMLLDLKTKIQNPHLRSNQKQSILRLYDGIKQFNDPRDVAGFPNKIKRLITYWDRYFRYELDANSNAYYQTNLQVYGKERPNLFYWKSLITGVIAGIFSLPNRGSGLKSADFAKNIAFFGLIAPPGELIGDCSFIANLFINTTAINCLIDNFMEALEMWRNKTTSYSVVDAVRIAVSLIVNVLYLFAQIGLVAAFPFIDNMAWEIVQIIVTAIAAYGLGTFALTNSLIDIQNYFSRFFARDQLGLTSTAAYQAEHPKELASLSSLATKEIASMIDLLTHQLRNLPNATTEQLFAVISQSIDRDIANDPRPGIVTIRGETKQRQAKPSSSNTTREYDRLVDDDQFGIVPRPGSSSSASSYGSTGSVNDEDAKTPNENSLRFFSMKGVAEEKLAKQQAGSGCCRRRVIPMYAT